MSAGLDVDVSPRGIATLSFNRPERSNAINQQVLDELARQFAQHAADDRTRIVVIRGTGKHFCSGADLVARASGEETSAGQTSIVDMLAALDRFPKPTIAAVHGAAVGGGAAIAACCDVVLATDDAFFSIPEVRIGMPPLGVAPFVIRAIGYRSFRRYGLSGERFGAVEALRVGLVHEVVSVAEFDEKLGEIADALLHGARAAQRALKADMEHSVSPSVEAILKRNASHGSPRTAEALEGIASFKEKRKPSWYPR
jgi:methylglutaconyl-CoA hydratase